MTNEQLAEYIQVGGNDELLAILWDKTKDLIFMKCNHIWSGFSDVLRRHGYELSDLTQEGYSALLYAVEQFDKDKPYKFTTYLNYSLKHVVRRLLNNRDVLNQAGTMQFDQPIGEDKDGGELLLSDIVPDEQAARAFEQAERAYEFKPLHEAVDSLPEQERAIIRQRYFDGLTLGQIAERRGVTKQAVSELERKALRLLRNGKTGRRLWQLYGDEYAPRVRCYHKGLSAFLTSGSSEVEDYVLRKLSGSGL